MNHQIHFAIQIVPISTTHHPYALIDKAIEVIKESGLRYEVCPMETVIEGDYDVIMKVIKKAQEACLEAGADEIVVTMKVIHFHKRKSSDASTYMQKISLPAQSIHHNSIFN
jgi:uncharacterized protein (TIGR00106 family)